MAVLGSVVALVETHSSVFHCSIEVEAPGCMNLGVKTGRKGRDAGREVIAHSALVGSSCRCAICPGD